MSENDLNLLRPFNLEAAIGGLPICTRDGRPARFIAYVPELDAGCRVLAVIQGCSSIHYCYKSGNLASQDYSGHPDDLVMAPLCWIEGRPVYPGDDIYVRGKLGIFKVDGCMVNGYLRMVGVGLGVPPECLTWTPPTVKREGFCIVHPTTVYESFEQAEARMKRDYPEGCFIAECKWEEPAP